MLVILCAGLMIGTISCGVDEDNPWVGTWSLETFEGENVQEQIAAAKIFLALFGVDFSYSDTWRFNTDETWERDITTVASETISYEVTGTYALSGSDYTLTPTFSTIPVEESETDSDADVGIDISESAFGNTKIDTGKWLLDGDILTLTSDTGKVYGFKKK